MKNATHINATRSSHHIKLVWGIEELRDGRWHQLRTPDGRLREYRGEQTADSCRKALCPYFESRIFVIRAEGV